MTCLHLIRSICLLLVPAALVACDGKDGVLTAYTTAGETTTEGAETAATGSSTTAATDASTMTAPATSSGTADETSTGSSTGEPDTLTATGPAIPGCVDDSDCVLINDCCVCAAFHVDEEPLTCDADCGLKQCATQGTPEAKAVCWDGVCQVGVLNCLAPPCEPL